MDRLDIYFAIRKKGYTLARLSRELHVAKSTMSDIMAGRQSSYRIASRIARLIGSTPAALWPQRVSYQRSSSRAADKAA